MSNPTELPDLDSDYEKRKRDFFRSVAPARRAQPEGEARCVICGSTEPRTGTCGSDDARALCRATEGKPEGEAPQAEPVAYLRQSTIDRLAKNETTGTAWAKKMADDYVPVYLAAPATQQAESGAQAAVKRALDLYAESYDRMSRIGDGKVASSDVAYDIDSNMIPSVLKALTAQSQGAPREGETFDQAKLMQLVRDFAEVCYGQRRTTEDVGGKLIEYVKSLAAKAEAPAAEELAHALRQAERLLRAAGFAMTGTASSQIVAAIAAHSTAAQQAATPGAQKWTAMEIANACVKAGLGILECNSLIVTLNGSAPSAPGTPEAPQTAAARDVLAERKRQVEVEGWTPARDDQYENDELSQAAACYAMSIASENNYFKPLNFWPWDMAWWKPQGTRRNLVKAGALILADIERLDRAAQLDGGQGEGK